MHPNYDAILVVAFGGPEKQEDVIPFLENVLRGRPVPRERMLEVAEHYRHFGGVSPINQQVREVIAALRGELDQRGIDLPIYWGNRNWHPLLPDTMRQMTEDGVQRALALVLSAYSSYSSCRQYRENIQGARESAGAQAPEVDKIRVFFNHPEFIEASAQRVGEALQQFDSKQRSQVHLAYTAHSIPISMASQCAYEAQLHETCRLISESLQIPRDRWELVYQSRSGRPSDPWLEPDILDHLRDVHRRGIRDVVVMPVGFLSDHMEVLFDLDEEARQTAEQLGLRMVRASTVGTHPHFISMLRELIEERITDSPDRRALGNLGPSHDVCPQDCCPAPRRPVERNQ